MSLLKNDHLDREKIRRETFYRPAVQSVISGPFSRPPPPDYTPVLLSYWTKYNLETYLIPVTREELTMLTQVNGIDCNGTGWEQYRKVFDYIERKRYDVDTHELGAWKDRYLVDTHDGEGHPLPPTPLPNGTILIITGHIPGEHD